MSECPAELDTALHLCDQMKDISKRSTAIVRSQGSSPEEGAGGMLVDRCQGATLPTSTGTEHGCVSPPSDHGIGLECRDPKQGVLEQLILTSGPLCSHLHN